MNGGDNGNSGRKPFFKSIFNYRKYDKGVGIQAESGYSIGKEKQVEIRKASVDIGATMTNDSAKATLSIGAFYYL